MPQNTVTQNDILKLLRLLQPMDMGLEFIRVGNHHDGGYIIPKYWEGISAVFSMGICDDDSFDREFTARSIPVFQFDPTINAAPSQHPFATFYKMAFGSFNGELHTTLDHIFEVTGVNHGQVLLKTDVEGGEWYGLSLTSDAALARIKVITGEFHQFEQLGDPFFFDLMLRTLEKLSKHFYFAVVAVNDGCRLAQIRGIPIPNLLELTLVRKDCLPTGWIVRPQLGVKHHLSTPTHPGLDEILWNPAWFLLPQY
jgi:hypothetical protein